MIFSLISMFFLQNLELKNFIEFIYTLELYIILNMNKTKNNIFLLNLPNKMLI